MILVRRLMDWLWPAPPTASLIEPTANHTAAFDLGEFGRLLSGGKIEDLQMIAKAMTKSDRVA
jgi:hypothetical protein